MLKRRVLLTYVAVLVFAAGWPALAPTLLPTPAAQSAAPTGADADARRWIPPGDAVEPRPLSALEHRFARQFPGRIDRYVEPGGEWIVRAIDRPTRLLHPAADCFRGLGYTVTPPRVRADADGTRWSCFSASRDGRHRQVCERLFDAGSGRWTDVSAWYWAALFKSAGPWWAVTRVSAE